MKRNEYIPHAKLYERYSKQNLKSNNGVKMPIFSVIKIQIISCMFLKYPTGTMQFTPTIYVTTSLPEFCTVINIITAWPHVLHQNTILSM